MMQPPYNVAVIGCGLIGTRRAREASQHSRSRLTLVTDVQPERRERIASEYACRAVESWKQVVEDRSIDVVIVSTPNGYSLEITRAALLAGKHVLVEKPPGRNLAEALQLADTARQSGNALKVGFNHRYHLALRRARKLFANGAIGDAINLHARYGHGGRKGYEKEWRCNPMLAGGGELLDQGVHVADLIQWFIGLPTEAFAFLQTAVWPIKPLEDNAFGLFRYPGGQIARLDTSWTQWKNVFSFEVFGTRGSLKVEGLGGSYGAERLIVAVRNEQGGTPTMMEERFDGPDLSWTAEWDEFLDAVSRREPYWGTVDEGVKAMRMIDALYRSAASGRIVSLTEPTQS